MKSVGIVCEYNPFHNGHLYHINEIKKMFPSYVVIAVINGDYTQRGDVCLINKWKKTEVALNYVDLVVELPFQFGTSSADIFTKAACDILNYLNISAFVFGSECGNIDKLKNINNIQKSNAYNNKVKFYLNLGYNYPKSLSLALKDFNVVLDDQPNDLLGIGYLRNLPDKDVRCIKRTNDYHSLELNNVSSGTSIRNALLNNLDISNCVPKVSLDSLNNLHFFDDYFDLLKYKIISCSDLSIYNGVDEGIENKIKKVINKANNIDELIKLTKSKRYTYNKLKRMYLHILCDFTKKDNLSLREVSYIRVLGFNEKGRKYLNSIKKVCKVPIITKYDECLSYEKKVSDIYNLRKKDDLLAEHQHSVIIR